MLNIIFMGTPDLAKESLEAINKKGYNIKGVVTNPDRQKGRGMKFIMTPVKEYAISNNLDVYQPEKIKENKEFIQLLKDLKPDVICVVAYGKILPKEILEIPKFGCINVHPSLLPKYRGCAPIQWAVLNGDKETGVSTMYLNEKMDEGDIILQEKVGIGEDETTGELWDRLSKVGADLLIKSLEKIEANDAPRIKQEGNVTYTPMIEKSMAKIEWEDKGSSELKNLVRGLNPFMGAYSTFRGKKIKLWKIKEIDVNEFVEQHEGFKEYKERMLEVEAGTIIYIDKKIGIYVKTIDGIILILELQAENSKRMSAPEFLRGNKIEVIEKFE